jgi:vacuolar-type H+-ATPase subunit C/Vma6
MNIEPNSLFNVWSPDEVAECLEGITPDLYKALWELTKFYPRGPRSEVPDDFARRALAKYWKKLSLAHRILLNELATADHQP